MPHRANSQPGTTVVKAYDVPAADLDRSLGVVRALCGQRSDVKVTLSRDTHQIIVLAPPELHAVIAARFAQELPAAPASPDEVAPAGSPTPSSADTERVLPLRALDAEGMEQRLIALFGRRLHVAQRDGSEVYRLASCTATRPGILRGSGPPRWYMPAGRSHWSLSLRRWWTHWMRAVNRATRRARCTSSERRPSSWKRRWMRTADASRKRRLLS